MATKIKKRKQRKAAAPLSDFDLLKRRVGRPAAGAIVLREQKLAARRAEALSKSTSVRELKRRKRGVSGGQPKPRLRNRALRRTAASKAPKGADGQRDGGAQKYT